MLKTLSKFVLEILPPVAATVIGAYLVHQFITMPREAAHAARSGAPQVVTIAKEDLDKLIGASHATVAAVPRAEPAAAAPATATPSAVKAPKRATAQAKAPATAPAETVPARPASTTVAGLPAAAAPAQPVEPAAVATPSEAAALEQDPLRIDTQDRDRLSAIAAEPLDLKAAGAPSIGERGRAVIGRVWASVTGALSDGLR